MSLEEELGYDLLQEGLVEPGKKITNKKRKCYLCGVTIRSHIKKHAMAAPLPWYIEPTAACWECEGHIRDLNRHVTHT